MAKPHSIPPFPADIDRNAFGHWLSGFTDGEGCFGLFAPQDNLGYLRPRVMFAIALRADDEEVLELIQSYFGVGHIYARKARPGTSQSQCCYRIVQTSHLVEIVIPHFQRCPMYAKKAQDFVLWQEAVQLAHTVRKRGRTRLGGLNSGFGPKWTTSELEKFIGLVRKLKQLRQFEGSSPVAPPPPLPKKRAPGTPTLFDDQE